MQKTHCCYRHGEDGSLREKRLARLSPVPAGPERHLANEGKRILAQERTQQQLNHVRTYLRLAAGGNPALRAMLQDPEKERQLVGMIGINDDGTLRWMNPGMLRRAEEWHPLFLQAAQEREAAKNRVSVNIDTQTKEASASSADLTAALDEFLKLGVAIPVALNKPEVKTILEKAHKPEVFKALQHAYVEFADSIIRRAGAKKPEDGTDYTHADVRAALTGKERELVAKLKPEIAAEVTPLLGAMLVRLQAFVAGGNAVFTIANKEPMLKLLQDSAVAMLSPTDPEKKILAEAVASVDTRLAALKSERTQVLLNTFPETLQFSEQLGGSDPMRMIYASIKENGQFDTNILLVWLKALGHTVTPEQSNKINERLALGNVALFNAETASDDQIARLIHDYAAKRPVELAMEDMLTNDPLVRAAALPLGVTNVAQMRAAIIAPGLLNIALRVAASLYVRNYVRNILLKGEDKFNVGVNLPLVIPKVWKPTGLEKYLKDEFRLDNPTGISFSAMSARVYLPKSVREKLGAEKLDGGISIGTLHKLANIEALGADPPPTTINAAIAKALVDTLVNPTNSTIQQSDFVEIFSVLYLGGKINATTRIDGAKAKEKAEAFWVWLTTKNTPPTIKKTGDVFTTNHAELITALQDARNWVGYGPADQIGADATEMIRAMRVGNFHNQTFTETTKKYVKEIWDITGTGLLSWWEALKEKRFIFWSDSDANLYKLLNEERALESAKKAITTVNNRTPDAHKAVMENVFVTLTKQHEERQKAVHGRQAHSVLENTKDAGDLLKAAENDMRILEQRTQWQFIEPIERRRTAFYIAQARGLNDAQAYLQDPDAYFKNPNPDRKLLQKEVQDYLARIAEQREFVRDDVTLAMTQRLGVRMQPYALNVLAAYKQKGKTGPLSIDPASVDFWLLSPQNSRGALNAILFAEPNVPPANKQALIDAFATGQPQQFRRTPSGPIETLSAVDARQYVMDIVERLKAQSTDFASVERQSNRRERFEDPLNLLRSGAETIGNMLQSGDKVEQGLAIAMLMGAGYVLWQGWKSKGLTRNLIVGIPLFLGADLVVKRMTGKGVLDRLHLNYQSEADSKGAMEQFMRRNERVEGTEFLRSEAGYESTRRLMSTKNPITLQEMLVWKRTHNQSGRGKFSENAPRSPNFQAAVTAVRGKLGNLEKDTTSSNARTEKAYEYLFLTFDALCRDVAVANGLGEPKVVKGAELLERRYIYANEPYQQGFRKEFLTAFGNKEGGSVSLYEVLVWERPPESMQTVLSREEYTEWAFRRLAPGARDYIVRGMRDGYTAAEMYGRYLREKGGQAFDYAVENVPKLAVTVANYGVIFGEKAYAALSTEAQASWNIVCEIANQAGILIQKTPDGINWVIDVGAGAVNFTAGMALALYREMLRHQGTGPPIEGLESFLMRTFGTNMGRLLMQSVRLESNDKRVEELANRKIWKKNFAQEIGAIAKNIPDGTNFAAEGKTADLFIQSAATKLGLDNDVDKLPPHQRMAVFELVKKRVFSLIIADRINAIMGNPGTLEYPIDISWTWKGLGLAGANDENVLAQEVFDSYSLQTLRLLGAERTIAGQIAEWSLVPPAGAAAGAPPSVGQRSLAFFRWALYPVARDDASEYVHGLKHYLEPYVLKAEKELGAGTDDFKRYKNYLETLVTNATIEVTLGGLARYRREQLTDPRVAEPVKEPLTLTILQAKEMLEYLLAMRSSAVELKPELRNLLPKFEPFTAADPGPNLRVILTNEAHMRRITGGEPAVAPVAPAPAGPGLTETERKDALDPLKVNLNSILGARRLAALFDKAKDETERKPLRDRFDANARGFDITKTNGAEEYAIYIQYVSPAVLKKVEEQLVAEAQNWNTLKDLVTLSGFRDRETQPDKLYRLQHALDRVTANLAQKLAGDIKAVAKDAVGAHPDFPTWEKRAATLYALSNPKTDKLSDTVSIILEYLKYRGVHEGYENFASHLTALSRQYRLRELTPSPKGTAVYQIFTRTFAGAVVGDRAPNVPAAATRLAKAEPDISADYLQEVVDRMEEIEKGL